MKIPFFKAPKTQTHQIPKPNKTQPREREGETEYSPEQPFSPPSASFVLDQDVKKGFVGLELLSDE